jgi:hypothetical protein
VVKLDKYRKENEIMKKRVLFVRVRGGGLAWESRARHGGSSFLVLLASFFSFLFFYAPKVFFYFRE